MGLIVVISTALLALSGAFEYRANFPVNIFPYQRAAWSCITPESAQSPAFLPCFTNSYVSLGGSNPYMLEGLYSSTVSCGYGTGTWGVQGYWTRTGMEGYAEHELGIGAGIRPVKYISLGLGACYYNWSIDFDGVKDEQHRGNISAALMIEPVRWLYFAFYQGNILSYFLKDDEDFTFPGWSLGAGIRPVQGVEVNWNITSTALGYINTVTASANLLRYFVLSLGYSKETFSYGASLTFVYRIISVSYGLRYHTHLGMSHSVSLTLSLKSQEVAAIDYHSTGKNIRGINIKKIDINLCTEEELRKISVLSPRHAERILKYRKLFGAITEKGLVQIGMSRSEISDLLDFVYPLAEKEALEKRQKNSGREFNRELFAELLEQGCAAEVSLKIAGLVSKGDCSALDEVMKGQNGFSESDKNRIMELCENSGQ